MHVSGRDPGKRNRRLFPSLVWPQHQACTYLSRKGVGGKKQTSLLGEGKRPHFALTDLLFLYSNQYYFKSI